MNTKLSDQQLDEFGAKLDAIQQSAREELGSSDRAYILRLIRVQRWLSLGGRLLIFLSVLCQPWWLLLGEHALASHAIFWPMIVLGTLLLASGKILENMEIGHNVMHGQWDWMNDPQVNSRQWEWDHACPSSQWQHSHNVEHHTWTNVLGKDRDVGYGMLRVTDYQPWHPFYLLQPLNTLILALYFEWFIAVHDIELSKVLRGKDDRTETKRLLREAGGKFWRQARKDYLLWPLLAGPFFPIVLAANFVANILRNLWTFAVIFCGHFPDGVEHFRVRDTINETRGQWYYRQLLGSCNIRGGKLFHIATGNLSHQIEHHMFPDLPSNRYAQVAPQVQQLCREYGMPYNSHRFSRQLGSTLWNLLSLSWPSKRKKGRKELYKKAAA